MKSGVEIEVNGAQCTISAYGVTPLLYVLRNELGLTGTRFGCGTESCGSCLILLENKPVYACTLPLQDAKGRRVTTIEGLGAPEHPHPIQRAFLEEQAGQCGYCLSGIMIRAKALLDAKPNPTRAEIIAALDKHLCRCGAHLRIVRAIERAAALIQAEADA